MFLNNTLMIFILLINYTVGFIIINSLIRQGNNFWKYFVGDDDDDDDDNKNYGINFCKCKCGISDQRYGRLLGGTDLYPYEFPWLANIRIVNKFVEPLPIPGTLINSRFIITAATPLIGCTPFDLKITMGMHDLCHPDVTSTIFSVSNILHHPEYIYQTRQNDITLLKLATLISFNNYISNDRIIPICLPTFNKNSVTNGYYEDKVAIITSWIYNGFNNNNINGTLSQSTCLPRKIGLPIRDRFSCSEKLLNSQSCVGVTGASNSLCSNDCGSGLMYKTISKNYELIGILSDKQSCLNIPENYNRLPVFTRIDSHLQWILLNTQDGCFCHN